MDKEGSIVVGTLVATGSVGIIACVATTSYTQGFFLGFAYLAFSGLLWVILGLRRASPRLAEMTSREVFWLPFAPIFLLPLWLAVAALVHEWKVDQPVIRYVGVAAGFILAVPAIVLHRWLSGVAVMKEKAQPGDQHNAGGRPSSDDSPASATQSFRAPRG